MPDSNHRPKVTVEDLIQLKRSERPSPEFWAGFERELRQKQLTALLNKRPWWRDIPQLLARRAYLPLGATAVLAISLLSVRHYLPASVASGENQSQGFVARAPDISPSVANTAAPATLSSVLVNRSEAAARVSGAREVVMNAQNDQRSIIGAVQLTAFVPVERDQESSPSARSIAANLARLEQAEPEMVNAVMGSRLSSPLRVEPAVVDDMAQLNKNPSKRSRLLAQYHEKTVSPEPAAADTVTERLARRLGDSEISERITRLDLRGPGVSLKF